MKQLLSTRLLALGIALGAIGSAAVLVAAAHGGIDVAQAAPVVALRKTTLGTILVDARGRTLYLFEKDRGGMSACDAAPACSTGRRSRAEPRLAQGAVCSSPCSASSGSATAFRQVTYAGHPLYTFVGDKSAGQTTGEGLTNFGADWYATRGERPEGRARATRAAAAAPAPGPAPATAGRRDAFTMAPADSVSSRRSLLPGRRGASATAGSGTRVSIRATRDELVSTGVARHRSAESGVFGWLTNAVRVRSSAAACCSRRWSSPSFASARGCRRPASIRTRSATSSTRREARSSGCSTCCRGRRSRACRSSRSESSPTSRRRSSSSF